MMELLIHNVYSILIQIKIYLKNNENIEYLLYELDDLYLKYEFNDKQCYIYIKIKSEYNNKINNLNYENYFNIKIMNLIDEFIFTFNQLNN